MLYKVTSLNFYFVSRLSSSFNCGIMNNYIKEYLDGDFSVVQLKSMYPHYHSFKVGVPATMWSKVFVPEFWP